MRRSYITLSLLLLIAACASATALYDKSKWTVATSRSEDVDGDGQKEEIYLLKSNDTAGYSGADEPMLGMRLIVAKNGKQVFSYSPNEDEAAVNKQQYFTDTKSFEIEDVTGDAILDIVFNSGQGYASDFETCTHIVVFNKEQKVFERVNPGKFCSMFNVGIALRKAMYNVSGYQVIESKPANGQVSGNKVEQPFDITVYTWSGQSFIPSKTFRSSRNYEGGQYAVDGEMYLIEKSMWPTMQGKEQLVDSNSQKNQTGVAEAKVAVVRGFYTSLSNGNGAVAVRYVTPAKRETGNYTTDGLSNFWGNLEVPLELLSISGTDSPNIFQAAYQFKARGKETCSDTATVYVESLGGQWYIQKIVPVIGC